MVGGQPEKSENGGESAGRALDRFVDSLARLGGVASAVEAVVATADRALYRRTAGYRVGGEPLREGCRFDAASLTKPFVATLARALDRDGRLSTATRLGDVFERVNEPVASATLDELLRHEAGIDAWAPLGPRLGRRVGEPEELAAFLLDAARWSARRTGASGTRAALYSDLGYILWGLAAERRVGRSLATLLDEAVSVPLAIASVGWLSAAPPSPVECRLDNGREVELAAEQGVRLAPQRAFHLGRPQDGNARTIGRLTGHAGLFLTADELIALARAELAAARRSDAGSGHPAGWMRASLDGAAGAALGATSFGHTGFTGGSLWIDPATEAIFVLLAHRLSSRVDFQPYRREFHRFAAARVREAAEGR